MVDHLTKDLTDLKNMADCQKWKGQRFKKIYVERLHTQRQFFQLSFKGMIRFDLNMEHDEVYGKFVFTVFVQFCNFVGGFDM